MAVYRPKYMSGGRSPIYHYDFTSHGKRYKGSTGEANKVKAREIEAEKRKEARAGIVRREIAPITFSELADKYLELHVSTLRNPGHYRVIVRRLREKFGKRMVASVSQLDCEGIMAERRRQTDKASTRNATLIVMKHLFDKAQEWGFLHEGANPARRLKCEKVRNTRERFPSPEDVHAIMAECEGWLCPIVQFSFLTGARKGECLRLTWDDVNFERDVVTFMDTKNGDNRHFPLGQQLIALLKGLPSRGIGQARVFQRDNRPLTMPTIDRYFTIARRKAGLDWVRFHDLRHGFASTMAAAGVPARTLMDLGGWKDLAVVLRYMHVSPSSRTLAVQAMDRAFGNPHQIPTKHDQIV